MGRTAGGDPLILAVGNAEFQLPRGRSRGKVTEGVSVKTSDKVNRLPGNHLGPPLSRRGNFAL